MGFELIKVRIIWRILVLIWTRSEVFHQNKTLITFMSVIASDLRLGWLCNRFVE